MFNRNVIYNPKTLQVKIKEHDLTLRFYKCSINACYTCSVLTPNNEYIYFYMCVCFSWISLVAQMVKNLPTMQEAQFQSLG